MQYSICCNIVQHRLCNVVQYKISFGCVILINMVLWVLHGLRAPTWQTLSSFLPVIAVAHSCPFQPFLCHFSSSSLRQKCPFLMYFRYFLWFLHIILSFQKGQSQLNATRMLLQPDSCHSQCYGAMGVLWLRLQVSSIVSHKWNSSHHTKQTKRQIFFCIFILLSFQIFLTLFYEYPSAFNTFMKKESSLHLNLGISPSNTYWISEEPLFR